jgi:hypothetical protein
MTKSDLPLSDHLILLVGGNPLPNAVAGKLLLANQGVINLVHSQATAKIADRLANWFYAQGIVNINLDAQVSETDAKDIFSRVSKSLPKNDKTIIGLNYTGGTKAMAIHTYRAIEAWVQNKQSPNYSYLDARTLRLCFSDGAYKYAGIHPDFAITLKEVLELQGLFLHHHKDIVDNPSFSITDDISHYQELNQKYNNGGKRFEQDVAQQLNAIHQSLQLTKPVMNVKAGFSSTPHETDPEFDVMALRGYQLYCLSCTTKDPEKRGGRNELKQKLFEIALRARQLGGDEACAGLICFEQNPDGIEQEVRQILGVEGRIKVFGRKHLSSLSAHLETWIRSQVGKE